MFPDADAGTVADDATATTTISDTATKAPDAGADPLAAVRALVLDLQKRVALREDDSKLAAERDKTAALKTQLDEVLQKKDVEGIKSVLEKLEGHFSGKLSEAQTKLAETEKKYHEATKRSTLGELTAGVAWATTAAARDALAKLDGLLEVQVDREGERIVRGKDGRAAAEVIKAALASDDFAHFLAPSQRDGKGGLGAGNRAAASMIPENGKPLDPVTAVVQRIDQLKEEARANGLAIPRGFGRPVKN